MALSQNAGDGSMVRRSSSSAAISCGSALTPTLLVDGEESAYPRHPARREGLGEEGRHVLQDPVGPDGRQVTREEQQPREQVKLDVRAHRREHQRVRVVVVAPQCPGYPNGEGDRGQ